MVGRLLRTQKFEDMNRWKNILFPLATMGILENFIEEYAHVVKSSGFPGMSLRPGSIALLDVLPGAKKTK